MLGFGSSKQLGWSGALTGAGMLTDWWTPSVPHTPCSGSGSPRGWVEGGSEGTSEIKVNSANVRAKTSWVCFS